MLCSTHVKPVNGISFSNSRLCCVTEQCNTISGRCCLASSTYMRLQIVISYCYSNWTQKREYAFPPTQTARQVCSLGSWLQMVVANSQSPNSRKGKTLLPLLGTCDGFKEQELLNYKNFFTRVLALLQNFLSTRFDGLKYVGSASRC